MCFLEPQLISTTFDTNSRAVDKDGQTIEFMLSAKRDILAAKRFLKKMMRADHRRLPLSISVDKNVAYPDAFTASQDENILTIARSGVSSTLTM